MSEKKNIENLFQEKFKDFEVNPNENIWENIEIKLKEEKEKRRIIPFWWKLSGIAASLLIGFLITNALFFNTSNIENNVVNQEKNNTLKENLNQKSSEKRINPHNPIVNSNTKNSSKENNTSSKAKNLDSYNNNNIVVSREQKIKNKVNKSLENFEKKSPNTTIVSLENKIKTGVTTSLKSSKYNTINNAIATSNNEKKDGISNSNSTNLFNNEIVSLDLEKEKNNPLENSLENNHAIQENNVVNSAKLNALILENNSKQTIELIIAEKEIENIKNSDTTKIAVVTNALEELLNEKETKKKAEPKLNRWQVATTVAPIYFSSTSGGSPLDSRFVSNDKKFEPSYSYGLGVNYAVSKKWSVKTGVNSLAFEYNTNDVVFFQNPNAREIKHVKHNLQGSVLQVESRKDVTTPTELTANGAVLKKFDGSINQRMGYIEVPVEIGYKLIDKKFGLEIITGLSTLFLNENAVSVVSSGQSITIGEANNLNDFHFSGNVGLGFRYRFLKSFNANVNPMFKYQMNTFNADSGNFKPYVFGLYTGVSYTF